VTAYTLGPLLVEDTFTRSGALGSTEAGSLGALAWQGNTTKLVTNGSEAVAANPNNAVSAVGSVYVNVPAGLSIRVAAETNNSAFDSFANAYLGVTARGDGDAAHGAHGPVTGCGGPTPHRGDYAASRLVLEEAWPTLMVMASWVTDDPPAPGGPAGALTWGTTTPSPTASLRAS